MLATRTLYTAFLGGMVTLPSMCNVYKSDVGKICDAEQLSQTSMKANRPQVFTWMERSVASSEAVVLVRDLEGKDAHGIALRLRDESRKVGLTACALAEQSEMQAKDDDFHTDLVNLCSGNAPSDDGSVARLDILTADDAERLRELQAWTTTNAKSVETAAVVAKIAAAVPKQRGAVLRTEAARVGVTQCLIALTLDTPPPSATPVDIHTVNPNFTILKIDGPAKILLSLSHAIIQKDPASGINSCYAIELAKNPTTQGKVALKLSLDPLGHVVKAVDEGSTMKGAIIPCMATTMLSVFLPPPIDLGKKGGPKVPIVGDPSKATVTFQLTPTTGDGWGAKIDPAWFAKNTPKKR